MLFFYGWYTGKKWSTSVQGVAECQEQFCIVEPNDSLIMERKQTDFKAQFICFYNDSNNGEVICSRNKEEYSK